MKRDNTKKIMLILPPEIIEHENLTPMQKLIHAVTFTYCVDKLGYNGFSNKELSQMLGIDVKSITKQRDFLVLKGFERKVGVNYYLNLKYQEQSKKDERYTLIPSEVYMLKIPSGAKILFGEYNSFSKDNGKCFASRKTLASRIKCSEKSITNWFNVLNEKGLIEDTELISGDNTKQRIVTAKYFAEKDEKTSKEEKIWKKYIDIKSPQEYFKFEFEVQDFLFSLLESINEDSADEKEILSVFLDMIDVKLGDFKFKDELKKQINEHLDSLQ